jgi:AcrR family transcriptional regulator
MRKRAAAVADTRRRIVDSAIELYQSRGVGRTSMLEVAKHADVAPGTVLNHFPTPDDLATAVVERLRDVLRVPDPVMLEGATTLRKRIARLSRALATFYERSEGWYRVYRAEEGSLPAWDRARDDFLREVDTLIRTALGPQADDEPSVSLISVILGPSVSGELRWRGMATERAADHLTDLLVPWLQRRAAAKHPDRP